MSSFCGRCGNRFSDDDRFCPACGAPRSEVANESPNAGPPPTVLSSPNAFAGQTVQAPAAPPWRTAKPNPGAARLIVVLALSPYLFIIVSALASTPAVNQIVGALFMGTCMVTPLIIFLFRPSWVARRLAVLNTLILIVVSAVSLDVQVTGAQFILFVVSGGLLSLRAVRRYADDDILFLWGGERGFFSKAIFQRRVFEVKLHA